MAPDTPIDMVLHCPACGLLHIDAPDNDPCRDGCQMAKDYGFSPREGHACSGSCGYLQDGSPRWTNPPHRSHLCAGCGHVWRPADVPTNGVAAVKTHGKADSPIHHPVRVTWDLSKSPLENMR